MMVFSSDQSRLFEPRLSGRLFLILLKIGNYLKFPGTSGSIKGHLARWKEKLLNRTCSKFYIYLYIAKHLCESVVKLIKLSLDLFGVTTTNQVTIHESSTA